MRNGVSFDALALAVRHTKRLSLIAHCNSLTTQGHHPGNLAETSPTFQRGPRPFIPPPSPPFPTSSRSFSFTATSYFDTDGEPGKLESSIPRKRVESSFPPTIELGSDIGYLHCKDENSLGIEIDDLKTGIRMGLIEASHTHGEIGNKAKNHPNSPVEAVDPIGRGANQKEGAIYGGPLRLKNRAKKTVRLFEQYQESPTASLSLPARPKRRVKVLQDRVSKMKERSCNLEAESSSPGSIRKPEKLSASNLASVASKCAESLHEPKSGFLQGDQIPAIKQPELDQLSLELPSRPLHLTESTRLKSQSEYDTRKILQACPHLSSSQANLLLRAKRRTELFPDSTATQLVAWHNQEAAKSRGMLDGPHGGESPESLAVLMKYAYSRSDEKTLRALRQYARRDHILAQLRRSTSLQKLEKRPRGKWQPVESLDALAFTLELSLLSRKGDWTAVRRLLGQVEKRPALIGEGSIVANSSTFRKTHLGAFDWNALLRAGFLSDSGDQALNPGPDLRETEEEETLGSLPPQPRRPLSRHQRRLCREAEKAIKAQDGVSDHETASHVEAGSENEITQRRRQQRTENHRQASLSVFLGPFLRSVDALGRHSSVSSEGRDGRKTHDSDGVKGYSSDEKGPLGILPPTWLYLRSLDSKVRGKDGQAALEMVKGYLDLFALGQQEASLTAAQRERLHSQVPTFSVSSQSQPPCGATLVHRVLKAYKNQGCNSMKLLEVLATLTGHDLRSALKADTFKDEEDVRARSNPNPVGFDSNEHAGKVYDLVPDERSILLILYSLKSNIIFRLKWGFRLLIKAEKIWGVLKAKSQADGTYSLSQHKHALSLSTRPYRVLLKWALGESKPLVAQRILRYRGGILRRQRRLQDGWDGRHSQPRRAGGVEEHQKWKQVIRQLRQKGWIASKLAKLLS